MTEQILRRRLSRRGPKRDRLFRTASQSLYVLQTTSQGGRAG